MAHASPPGAVVRENVRARGAPGVVERLLEALCETRMETPAAAPMGLACQSLLVRDDGGGVCHPFQYGGAGPTSASELKHRISGVVSGNQRSRRASGRRGATLPARLFSPWHSRIRQPAVQPRVCNFAQLALAQKTR